MHGMKIKEKLLNAALLQINDLKIHIKTLSKMILKGFSIFSGSKSLRFPLLLLFRQ